MEAAGSPPPEAVAPADPPAKVDIQPAAGSPPPEAAAADVPPTNEDSQPVTTVDAPPEAAAPADSPAKEEIQPAATADAPGSDAGPAGETVVLDPAAEAREQEEEGDCPFCLYMKGGGCKEEFIEWEKCVEEADLEGDSNVVERCGKLMTALGRCMYNYPDYHEPILGSLVHPKIWQEDVPM